MSIIPMDLIGVLGCRAETSDPATQNLEGGTHGSIPGKNLVYLVDSRRRGHHAMVSGCSGRRHGNGFPSE
jgi:hypothetical protein